MTVPKVPKDPSQGEHTIPFHSTIFIEHSDFREVHTLISHFKLLLLVLDNEVGEHRVHS